MVRNIRSFRPIAENLEGRKLLGAVRPSATPWIVYSPFPVPVMPLTIPASGSVNQQLTVPSDGWYSLQFTVNAPNGLNFEVDGVVHTWSFSNNTGPYNYTSFPLKLQAGTAYTATFTDFEADGDSNQSVSNIQLVSVAAPAF